MSREFMDSVSTVMYMLGDPGDGGRYTSYVMDSLIAEREFLEDVREQVAQRSDVMLPIGERINRSIPGTLKAAGVREEDIPSRRNNGWPDAQGRLELLGPTAYAAYRTGSPEIAARADLGMDHGQAFSEPVRFDRGSRIAASFVSGEPAFAPPTTAPPVEQPEVTTWVA